MSEIEKNETSKGERAFHIWNYFFFIAFVVICVYPFYYLFINSISANNLSANGAINWLPKGIHWSNYSAALGLSGLGTAAFVSLARTVLGTALTVIASAFLGFMFTQRRLWHRQFWYRAIIITMYFNAGIIPMYITFKNLGLTNSFWVYILPAIVQPFNIILVKTFIESLPKSLEEAAEMDGASTLTVFFKIILPSCTPILATVAIFAAVAQWNSFQDTLLYITDQRLYSLQYILYQYINQASSLANIAKNSGGAGMASVANQQTATSIQMTVSVLVVLPILFIYPMFQRYFVKGIMLGAVKG